jgi:hypothetical protein
MPSKAAIAQKIRAYYTGLIPMPGEQLEKEVRGRGWSMKMGLRPDKCRHDYNCGRPSHDYDQARPEIVICAHDIHRAAAVLGLFMDSLQVLFGPEIWEVNLKPVPEEDDERHELREMLDTGSTMFSSGGFDLAAMLAKTASCNRRFAYAIALHAVSCQNHVNQPMDLEPANYPYRARSSTHRDHVRFAYAIIAAYAAIEQLKLCPEPHSFKDHAWIPEKRQALEAKLKRAGVDLTETLMWHVRGGKTRLELDRPPKIVKMCPWSYAQIRDCEVEIVDAIADIRALRSNVAAHDVKDQAKYLSVHDVVNAQLVARQLILAATGFSKQRIERIIAARKYPKQKPPQIKLRKMCLPEGKPWSTRYSGQ